MKVYGDLIRSMHLDVKHSLLPARSVQMLLEFFALIDVRGKGFIDDIVFTVLMEIFTDLGPKQIENVFNMFDVDLSGCMEFDEFYLLICMLIAIKDGDEKLFLFRHSKICFQLLDVDGSGTIDRQELERLGIIFNFSTVASRRLFDEFDINGNKQLDVKEFQMLTLACLDEEQKLVSYTKEKRKEGGFPWLWFNIKCFFGMAISDVDEYLEKKDKKSKSGSALRDGG
ncbi:EF-hand calcium-binding domain-containing protein 9 like protein [Aduncisulcus paluster]|uniref:EF-hand calcium-binding domain-containing protein 9 like protein n=1 Tax=Aduncisulcus paluster TaxID=2918883 RepID=A0ABQ5KQW5_9EUKA|nr:EF-hand calcium-binding domain-containing protein 9 like protein [Aduncisulcus paluster]